MDPLTTLGNKYGTNKANYHRYTRFYHSLFKERRETVNHFFEIGIESGSSLFMWRDYFPNSTIYGIDVQVVPVVKNQERLVWSLCDQSKEDQLKNVLESWSSPTFDAIIDDGGHVVSQQRITIETLWKYLAPGGIYIIEDLHTNIPELFYNHAHMLPHQLPKYLDEPVSNHMRILDCMIGTKGAFQFPTDEIEDILYFSNVPTKSLSCAFIKKNPRALEIYSHY